jgi:hypothetical protein
MTTSPDFAQVSSAWRARPSRSPIPSVDYTVLDIADDRFASLQLVSYLPTPGTGTREKMERLLRGRCERNATP